MRLLICGLAATAMLAATPADAGHRNKCKTKHRRHNDCCYTAPVSSCCDTASYSTSVVYGSSSDCGCSSTVTPVSYAAPASDCGCSATYAAPASDCGCRATYSAPASDCGCAATSTGCGATTTYAASTSDCGCSASAGTATPTVINGERVVPGSVRVISNGEAGENYNPAPSNDVEDAPAPPAENNGGEQNANGADRPKA